MGLLDNFLGGDPWDDDADIMDDTYSAYLAGERARTEGWGRGCNPYIFPGAYHSEWNRGYDVMNQKLSLPRL